jgi:hypothetical protein
MSALFCLIAIDCSILSAMVVHLLQAEGDGVAG